MESLKLINNLVKAFKVEHMPIEFIEIKDAYVCFIYRGHAFKVSEGFCIEEVIDGVIAPTKASSHLREGILEALAASSPETCYNSGKSCKDGKCQTLCKEVYESPALETCVKSGVGCVNACGGLCKGGE